MLTYQSLTINVNVWKSYFSTKLKLKLKNQVTANISSADPLPSGLRLALPHTML